MFVGAGVAIERVDVRLVNLPAEVLHFRPQAAESARGLQRSEGLGSPRENPDQQIDQNDEPVQPSEARMADIYGTNGSDTVTGTNGDDNIHGGDAIPGGSDVGDDTLNGGNGNDRLWGEGGNDILNGDDGDDFLFGDIGDDTCNGGAGNDEIEVTRGNDIVNGGIGIDLLTFFEKSAGITISLAVTVAQDSGDGIYTIHNIENLTGGFSNDTLIGNDGDNVIRGGGHAFGYDGNDWLDGGAGHDSLFGNRGTDTLTGGLGDDTLRGGNDDDTYILDTIYRPDIFAKFRYDAVVEYTYGGIDTVKIQRVGNTEAYTLTANVENGLITGTETFTLSGNELANQLTGNGAANTLYGMAENDVLDGGVGNDTMHGGSGNDTYYVDNFGDKVFEANGSGTDTVRTSVSFSVASQFVENVGAFGQRLDQRHRQQPQQHHHRQCRQQRHRWARRH
jgi:Ca2+-binding RTX toxin-like protein